MERSLRYYEDLEVGSTAATDATYLVTEEEVLEFGRRFDPQPFHTDPEAAAASEFGGLIASTVHILAMHVSLGVKGEHATAAISGLGMTNLVNHAPVRPGNVLSHVNEVIDRRPSESRPGAGVVTFRNTLSNERGERVFSYENAALIRYRPSDDPSDERAAPTT
jgi:acyl dehydratase